MHRKDYKAIAAVLAGEFACCNNIGRLAIWDVTLSLADVFKQDNIRFDRAKFYEAVFGAVYPNLDHFAVRDKLTNKPGWMREHRVSPHGCYPEGS